MARESWKFKYSGTKLLEAAVKKVSLHESRLKWWEDKKKETMDKIKAAGLEIHDSVAAGYSNKTSGYGARIEVDAGITICPV